MINKKVRNATPLEYNGLKFKSKLEVFCFKQLVENNIKASYEDHTFSLMEKYIFKGYEYPERRTKIVQPITYTPDFVIDRDNMTIIIECKGFRNDIFPVKWKLFKSVLNNIPNKTFYLFLPKNQKQVLETIEQIKTILNNES